MTFQPTDGIKAVRLMALPLECQRLIKHFAFEPHPVALLLKPLVWVEEDSTMGLTRRNIYSKYDEENPNDEPFFFRRMRWSSTPDKIERSSYFRLHTYWWPIREDQRGGPLIGPPASSQ